MTRETKEELLLMMLFLGFRLFRPSPLLMTGDRAALPSPKALTVEDLLLPLTEAAGLLVSLVVSIEVLGSFSGSLTSLTSLLLFNPRDFHRNRLLVAVVVLYRSGVICFGFSDTSDNLTPLVGGTTLVAKGLGLMMGASDG